LHKDFVNIDTSPYFPFHNVGRSARRDLGQVLHSKLPVALRRETPTQYPCCVGSASE